MQQVYCNSLKCSRRKFRYFVKYIIYELRIQFFKSSRKNFIRRFAFLRKSDGVFRSIF